MTTAPPKIGGEYFSEQSQSLPGVSGASSQGPTGFLPGMFHSKEDSPVPVTVTGDKAAKTTEEKDKDKDKSSGSKVRKNFLLYSTL